MFALYILGMILAVVSGLIFQGHAPHRQAGAVRHGASAISDAITIGNTLTHVWDRVKGFLVKAGTLIFLMSIVLWFLQNFNVHLQMVQNSADGMLAGLGSLIAPIFKPMGFGMWQAAVALLTGLVAKEAVVASLSMFYGFSLTAGSLVWWRRL